MTVFLDTSAYIALESRSDGNHQAAVRTFRRLVADRVSLWTSDHVFDETVTLLSRRVNVEAAVAWGKRALASRLISIEISDADTIRRALAVLEDAPDQAFSFTDCCSFAMMRARRTKTAFTFDQDFKRFGFEQVPRRR